MMYKTILFPLVGQSVCHIHYTIKQTCLTFKRTSVINRIFYTVEGVLSILAVSRLISLSFLKSQYTRSIHNKSWQSKFIMSYLKNSPGLKGLRLFNESLDLSHCLLRVRYMASLGGGGGGFSDRASTTCPSCSSPLVWSEGILDLYASVSSASLFRDRPQCPLRESGCTDPTCKRQQLEKEWGRCDITTSSEWRPLAVCISCNILLHTKQLKPFL